MGPPAFSVGRTGAGWTLGERADSAQITPENTISQLPHTRSRFAALFTILVPTHFYILLRHVRCTAFL